MRRFHLSKTPVVVLLIASLCLPGCASMVQLHPPYDQKIRIGDHVDVVAGDKTLRGSVVYLDAEGLVIKTGKAVQQYSPVKTYTFTTQLSWSEVRRVRVHGILDRRGKLISDEEIKVNRRTAFRRILPFNIGILGCAASFGLGVFLQDQIFPPLGQKSMSSLNRGRAAFWVTWTGGTLLSTTGAYYVGRLLDRHRAIQRVEKIRTVEGPSYSQVPPQESPSR